MCSRDDDDGMAPLASSPCERGRVIVGKAAARGRPLRGRDNAIVGHHTYADAFFAHIFFSSHILYSYVRAAHARPPQSCRGTAFLPTTKIERDYYRTTV